MVSPSCKSPALMRRVEIPASSSRCTPPSDSSRQFPSEPLASVCMVINVSFLAINRLPPQTANSLRRKAYVLSADVSLGLLRLRNLLHPDIGAQLAELAHQILVATLDILYLRQLRFALSGQTGDDQSRTGP